MKCKKCGAEIPVGEIACPGCHIAVALMSQIKTEEDKNIIAREKMEEEKPPVAKETKEEVKETTENLDIRFDAGVLKDVSDTKKTKQVKKEEKKETEVMQPKQVVNESVDKEEVQKALAKYDTDGKKDIHFFLPIIIGIIMVILLIVGVIYGITLLV